MRCAKSGSSVGTTARTAPCTGSSDDLLIPQTTEYVPLNYLLSGNLTLDVNALKSDSSTLKIDVAQLKIDVADLKANGGGGSTNFVPAYEAQSVICVQQNATTHALEVMNPQPTDKSTCTMIVGSFTESGGSLFSLTESQGAEIGIAMFAALAVAFAFRMVVRAIQETDSEKESS